MRRASGALKSIFAAALFFVLGQGAAMAALNGYHDVGNCSILAGWAWESNTPITPISVDIYDGNNLIATVAASQFRQDLLNAGIGDGKHSFQITTPASLIDGQPHTVTVKFAGTQQNLNATPKTVSCISPGVPTPQYNGYHDVGNCSIVAGWAWDANRPTTPISVDIYVDGVLNQTVLASQFRQDLLDAGIGDGNHSFQINTPAAAINGQPQTITIKFSGTPQNLNTTPKTVACLAPGVPVPQYNGYHDTATCTVIQGWAWDANQPNTPINVDIYADNSLLSANVPANNFRQDLLDAGIGNGVHAFNVTTPNSVKNNEAHTITIKFAGTQTNLNTTPKSVTCASVAATTMYFIQVDHLNTPRLIADTNQQTVWRWDQQEPFGVNSPDENPSRIGSFQFALRFPGQYADQETNLYYNGYREYDSSSGTYKESDPIGVKGGLNTYAYVLDPLTQTDPFGLMGRGPAGMSKGYLKTTSPCGQGMATVPELGFGAACRAHDKCYSTCGKPREECDHDFCSDTMGSCGPSDRTCRVNAWIYCNAVLSVPDSWYYVPAQEIACKGACKRR